MALRPSVQQVLNTLQEEGHLGPDAVEPARTALEAHQRKSTAVPWFVRAFSGLGAWMAAVFVVSFFACTGILENKAVMGVLGLFLCGGATFLRREVHGVFVEQLALALCLAGAWMMVASIGIDAESEVTTAFAGLTISAVLLAIYPDAVLRFLSTGGIIASASVLAYKAAGGYGVDLLLLGSAVLMHVLIVEQVRLRQLSRGDWVGPVAFSLAFIVPAALLVRGTRGLSDAGFEISSGMPNSVLTLGLTALTLYTVWRVLQELRITPTGVAGAAVFAALALLAVLTPHTPAVIAAVGMLVLGFHRRSSVLLGLAVTFLLAAGSYYYYDLGLTLLAKSLALMGGGLVFLGLRSFLLRRFPAPATEVR
ncbi:putative membrane protein [Myxococcus hansupus]|uniref:Putative membrane protein n=1 Tax=Pseudomyxococcus hansupus TaxID=1297742 RepID=A0A0H4WLQ4_9BACT|nr:DUF4401 domain-containing protein [Myxococcus hansupus]AKQ64326.1 putative membrane protein [Myxococcus hansupus]